MDTVYPEKMSLLYKRPVRKKMRGNHARYRTQPVTFAEIKLSAVMERMSRSGNGITNRQSAIITANDSKEVDEENIDEIAEATKPSKSDIDLNRKFDEFKKLHRRRLIRLDAEDANYLSPIDSPENDTKINPIDSIVKSSVNLTSIRNSGTTRPKLIPRTSI